MSYSLYLHPVCIPHQRTTGYVFYFRTDELTFQTSKSDPRELSLTIDRKVLPSCHYWVIIQTCQFLDMVRNNHVLGNSTTYSVRSTLCREIYSKPLFYLQNNLQSPEYLINKEYTGTEYTLTWWTFTAWSVIGQTVTVVRDGKIKKVQKKKKKKENWYSVQKVYLSNKVINK